jgi:hypothetical protein
LIDEKTVRRWISDFKDEIPKNFFKRPKTTRKRAKYTKMEEALIEWCKLRRQEKQVINKEDIIK